MWAVPRAIAARTGSTVLPDGGSTRAEAVAPRGETNCTGIYAVGEASDREDDFALAPSSKATLYRQKKSGLKVVGKEVNLVSAKEVAPQKPGVGDMGRVRPGGKTNMPGPTRAHG